MEPKPIFNIAESGRQFTRKEELWQAAAVAPPGALAAVGAGFITSLPRDVVQFFPWTEMSGMQNAEVWRTTGILRVPLSLAKRRQTDAGPAGPVAPATFKPLFIAVIFLHQGV